MANSAVATIEQERMRSALVGTLLQSSCQPSQQHSDIVTPRYGPSGPLTLSEPLRAATSSCAADPSANVCMCMTREST